MRALALRSSGTACPGPNTFSFLTIQSPQPDRRGQPSGRASPFAAKRACSGARGGARVRERFQTRLGACKRLDLYLLRWGGLRVALRVYPVITLLQPRRGIRTG